jgi:putative IMPACT (imprinted ancient) family translation regulator
MMIRHQEIAVVVEYTWLGKLENELRNRDMLMGDTEFTDQVVLHCLPLASEAQSFVDWMTDMTQGQAIITAGEQRYIPHSVEE